MKFLIASLPFFLPFMLSAQVRVTIIDKNESTALLFDGNNPKSLISLIETNEIPVTPMTFETCMRLQAKGSLKNAPMKLAPLSDIAMTTVDGEDSMRVENGVLQFVYPPRDTFYTDFKDISRLIVYQNIDQNSQYLINRIEMAKKYETNGKFEIVGSFEYAFMDSIYNLFYTDQLPSKGLNTILNDGLWQELKANQVDQNPMIEKPILNFNTTLCSDYSPYINDFLQPNRIKWATPYQNKNTWLGKCNKLDRFDRYGWELYYGYENVHGFEGLQPDIPIATIDGHDSIVMNGGTLCFVYSPAEFYPTWIDTLPSKAFLLNSIAGNNIVLKRILFTTGENNELLADLNCEDPRIKLYLNQLSSAEIQLQRQEITWRSVFLTTLNSSKRYDPGLKKDLKKFNKKLAE